MNIKSLETMTQKEMFEKINDEFYHKPGTREQEIEMVQLFKTELIRRAEQKILRRILIAASIVVVAVVAYLIERLAELFLGAQIIKSITPVVVVLVLVACIAAVYIGVMWLEWLLLKSKRFVLLPINGEEVLVDRKQIEQQSERIKELRK